MENFVAILPGANTNIGILIQQNIIDFLLRGEYVQEPWELRFVENLKS